MKKYFSGMVATLLLLSLSACNEDISKARHVDGLSQYLPVLNPEYNVLVISFDSLRADALGLYGYNRDTSPNLDDFASRSIVFGNAYSAAQSTPTSFASAWTGQLPFRVFRGWKLKDKDTLAAKFSAAGYKTVGFTDNQQLMHERGFSEGFNEYQMLPDDDDKLLALSNNWLENNHKEKFFGWFHFLSPHSPYTYRDMAKEFYQADYSGRFERTTKGKFEVNNNAELKRVRDLYDGEIFYADSLFKKLMDKLADLGIDNKTIIVLTSDHGEEFMDHGGLQHNTVYEEVIRIPMIIYHPDLAAGVRVELPYSNTDLYKTLPALVGLTSDKITDGLNLLESVPEFRPVIATAMTSGVKRQYGMVMQGDKYHLDCKPESAERLFDLKLDTAELNDIALDHPDKLEYLYETLELVTGDNPCKVLQAAVAGKAVDSDLTKEQMERLKSLGYIQ